MEFSPSNGKPAADPSSPPGAAPGDGFGSRKPIWVILWQLIERVARIEAFLHAASRTTLRGRIFEQTVLEALQFLARVVDMLVQPVGFLDKPGDILLDVLDPLRPGKRVRLVVEVKAVRRRLNRKQVEKLAAKVAREFGAVGVILVFREPVFAVDHDGIAEGVVDGVPWVATLTTSLHGAIMNVRDRVVELQRP